jgi:hypothetical protein
MVVLDLAAGFQAGSLQSNAALVYTDPARLEVGAGQVETLQILLMNADKVYGIDLQAAYDPAVVDVVDADPSKTGIQLLPGTFPKPDYVVRNQADNKTGSLTYVVTQLNPTTPSSGGGLILSVLLRGKVIGSRGQLTFTAVVLADRSGAKQPVRTQAAELVVVAPKALTPTKPAGTAVTRLAPTLAGVTAAPGDTAQSKPAGKTGTTAAQGTPIISEGNLGASDKVITGLTIGGFTAAGVMAGVAVWLLVSKRRKGSTEKPK